MMMGWGSALRVVDCCLVTPSDETPRRGLWLSALDLVLANRGHTPLVHVYDRASHHLFNVAKLKESLAKALVPFYPLAGRLGADSDDGRIQIDCNGEGALFVVAHSQGPYTVDDLGADPELTKLFKPRMVEPTMMLAVQVTFLRCGGVVLGTSVHHAAVDGSSTFHFIRTWARYCRDGVVVAEELPCHDRGLLRARSPPVVHPETIPMLCGSLAMHAESSSVASTEVIAISREQLHALKRHCGGATTFCAVSALVWQCVCAARGAGLDPDATTRISFPVDIRRRLTPPLPERYFGNGVVNVFATATAKDVVSGTLASLAGRVKAAAERLDDDDVLRSAVDYFETKGSGGGVREDRGHLPETEVRVNSWFHLPMYDADFGWGKPRVTTRAEAVRGGWVYLMAEAGGHGGGAQVLVSLEPATLSKFQRAVNAAVRQVVATERAARL